METAFVLLTVEIGFEEDVLKALKGIPEVKESFRVYGVYDIIFQVEADTREDVKNLVRKIKQMEKVQSTLTMIVIWLLFLRAHVDYIKKVQPIPARALAAGVTDVTIRNRYKELKRRLDPDFFVSDSQAMWKIEKRVGAYAKEVKRMTVCRGCQLIECVNNTRMQSPTCKLDDMELNNKGECAMSKIDYQYLRNQFREKSARAFKLLMRPIEWCVRVSWVLRRSISSLVTSL